MNNSTSETSCATCWWQEGGRCYLEPVERLPDGRSTKIADVRCNKFWSKKEALATVFGSAMERCEECNHELTQCGPQDDDGEPTLDCLVCILRAKLSAAQAEAAKLREAIESEPELPGDMPDAVWIILQSFSRDQMQAYLKGSVKRIKTNILKRINTI